MAGLGWKGGNGCGGLGCTEVLRQVCTSCGGLPAVFWGLSCVRVLWWVGAKRDGLAVLEQKVTSGVDARMQAIPACIRSAGEQGQPKMCNICVMGTICKCSGEAFLCPCGPWEQGVLCIRGGWCGKRRKKECRFGEKAVPSVPCLCRQVVIWET